MKMIELDGRIFSKMCYLLTASPSKIDSSNNNNNKYHNKELIFLKLNIKLTPQILNQNLDWLMINFKTLIFVHGYFNVFAVFQIIMHLDL